ncbi:MAG: hypothetical protein F6K03_04890 [Kamptonema sp. SIO4C4]|nr:hypothetical protein [Kamptonema sp. SIO4C4]
MTEPDTISIITQESPESVEGERIGIDVGGGFSRAAQEVAKLKQRTEVPVDALKEEMGKLYTVMTQLFNQFQSRQPETLRLDEVELSIEVNSKGQVSIVGMGGEVSGKGAITLKFKRVPASNS